MWEPRHLTTLWAFTACYRDSFPLPFMYIGKDTGSISWHNIFRCSFFGLRVGSRKAREKSHFCSTCIEKAYIYICVCVELCCYCCRISPIQGRSQPLKPSHGLSVVLALNTGTSILDGLTVRAETWIGFYNELQALLRKPD
jgi:hypothetical protein